LTNHNATANIFQVNLNKMRNISAPERICSHESFQKNILQGLPDRIENRSAVPALPEAQNRRQRESTARGHSEEKNAVRS